MGGMFVWARLPAGLKAMDLLPMAVQHGVAFVPGSAFFAENPDPRSLRLSFVTPGLAEIESGIAALARSIEMARISTEV